MTGGGVHVEAGAKVRPFSCRDGKGAILSLNVCISKDNSILEETVLGGNLCISKGREMS